MAFLHEYVHVHVCCVALPCLFDLAYLFLPSFSSLIKTCMLNVSLQSIHTCMYIIILCKFSFFLSGPPNHYQSHPPMSHSHPPHSHAPPGDRPPGGRGMSGGGSGRSYGGNHGNYSNHGSDRRGHSGSGSSSGVSNGNSGAREEREGRRGERERGERERGDRERGDRERGDRERGDRERGDRERGDRERGDRERGDRERGDREKGDREREPYGSSGGQGRRGKDDDAKKSIPRLSRKQQAKDSESRGQVHAPLLHVYRVCIYIYLYIHCLGFNAKFI